MPTYEFRCPSGHSFERFYRKIADAATELECPVCGKVAARQLTGGAGLVFKGSGFYLTDYGRNAHRNGGAGKASDKPTESAGEAKAESKPEGKSSESKGESGSSSAESKSRSDAASDKPASKSDSSNAASPKKPGSSGGSTS
jgi:putative FmdB family regulatory protein